MRCTRFGKLRKRCKAETFETLKDCNVWNFCTNVFEAKRTTASRTTASRATSSRATASCLLRLRPLTQAKRQDVGGIDSPISAAYHGSAWSKRRQVCANSFSATPLVGAQALQSSPLNQQSVILPLLVPMQTRAGSIGLVGALYFLAFEMRGVQRDMFLLLVLRPRLE